MFPYGGFGYVMHRVPLLTSSSRRSGERALSSLTETPTWDGNQEVLLPFSLTLLSHVPETGSGETRLPVQFLPDCCVARQFGLKSSPFVVTSYSIPTSMESNLAVARTIS